MTEQFSISRRPRTLDSFIGQEKTIKEMKKRSKDGSWPQAMMLEGSTGTGKTTLGFIIASLINCSNPIDKGDHFEPCGKCASCKSVIEERFSRSITLKDCSSMGKDDVLALESLVTSQSLYGDEKTILILEEAQQLASAGAKGALLKLLEKPRKNVHFILLTMDVKKFDKSIRDRCQVYKFKKHTTKDILDYLFKLLEEIDPDEKIPETFIDEVLPVLVDNAEGSIRKALEDFERCYYSEIYTKAEAISELSYIDEKSMFDLLTLIVSKDKIGLDKIKEYDDILTFFNYSWKILSNVEMAEVIGYPTDWQESRGRGMMKTGNFKDLVKVYLKTNEENSSYFNEKVFLHYLTEFYNEKKEITNYVNDSKENRDEPVTHPIRNRVRERR